MNTWWRQPSRSISESCAPGWARAATDRARALRPAGELERELGHERPLALVAIGADGLNPFPVPDRKHRLAHVLGHVHADREADAPLVEVVEQLVAEAGRVRPDEQLGLLDDGPRELPQGLIDRLYLVSGRVRARVAGTQDARRGLLRFVEVAEHRVKAKAALVVAGGILFVGVRADQRGVEVEHDPLGLCPERPGPLARLRARLAQPTEHPLVRERVDHPPCRRVRGNAAKEVLLVAQRPKIREAIAAVGEHHAEVAHDLPGIVRGAALARRPEGLGEGVGQSHLVRHGDEQTTAGVRR